MEKCIDNLEREFYIRMTRRMGWTKNVLIHQIENKSYEKTVTSQTNFSQNLPAKIRNQAKLAVKDEYVFENVSTYSDKKTKRFSKIIFLPFKMIKANKNFTVFQRQ